MPARGSSGGGKRDGSSGDGGGGFERWNTHFSTVVEQELFGMTFRLAQDPNSHHLGMSVWDASIVLAKYLEKNATKGEFSRQKVKGKRCIELGAGMGLGGLAFAMLGAEVLLTDVAEVLPLLRQNYSVNCSPAALRAAGSHWAGQVGPVKVQELDWARPEQYEGVGGLYDFVLAADCVYHEHIVKDLHATIMAVTHAKSTVVVVNELRSESVQAAFLDTFSSGWSVKRVLGSKLDPKYQHALIHVYLLKRKRGTKVESAAAASSKHREPAVGEEEGEGSPATPAGLVQPVARQPASRSSAAGAACDVDAGAEGTASDVDAGAAACDVDAGTEGAVSDVDAGAEGTVCDADVGAAACDVGATAAAIEAGGAPAAEEESSARQWEMRRQGAQAAALLANMHLTGNATVPPR